MLSSLSESLRFIQESWVNILLQESIDNDDMTSADATSSASLFIARAHLGPDRVRLWVDTQGRQIRSLFQMCDKRVVVGDLMLSLIEFDPTQQTSTASDPCTSSSAIPVAKTSCITRKNPANITIPPTEPAPRRPLASNPRLVERPCRSGPTSVGDDLTPPLGAPPKAPTECPMESSDPDLTPPSYPAPSCNPQAPPENSPPPPQRPPSPPRCLPPRSNNERCLHSQNQQAHRTTDTPAAAPSGSHWPPSAGSGVAEPRPNDTPWGRGGVGFLAQNTAERTVRPAERPRPRPSCSSGIEIQNSELAAKMAARRAKIGE